jgi:Zn-dependent M28 family amino/carboxypeptidase
MTLRLEPDDSATSNIVGRVEGTSDEYVIVIAHHDAYFDGAVDNASGVAAMLGLARHFASYGQPLRRTHIFVATGGHHAGGFPGSTKFAEDNLDIRDRTAIVLNAEHVAAVHAIQYTAMDFDQWGSEGGLLVSNAEVPRYGSIVPENALVLEQFAQSLARYGVTMLANAWDQAPGDVWPFQRRGYPVGQIIEVGNWYHTTGDSLYTVHVPALERATRAFADFLHRVDALPLDQVNLTALDRDEARGPRYARPDAADPHPDIAGAGPQ